MRNSSTIVSNIDSTLGNEIIEALIKEGWVVEKEYSKFAFDKGIDYDQYKLKKGQDWLDFEWSNWFEWEVKGSSKAIQFLADTYNFESSIQPDSSN